MSADTLVKVFSLTEVIEMKKRKSYMKAFKLDAVKLVTDQGYKRSECIFRPMGFGLGISPAFGPAKDGCIGRGHRPVFA
jgi:hypothetical protein